MIGIGLWGAFGLWPCHAFGSCARCRDEERWRERRYGRLRQGGHNKKSIPLPPPSPRITKSYARLSSSRVTTPTDTCVTRAASEMKGTKMTRRAGTPLGKFFRPWPHKRLLCLSPPFVLRNRPCVPPPYSSLSPTHSFIRAQIRN